MRKKDHSGNRLLPTFNFQCVINDKIYRSLQRHVKVSNTEWVEQILNSGLHLNYVVNILHINISFVITATKSTWFYLRNNASPILGLKHKEDFLGLHSIEKKKRKREIRINSLLTVLTKRTSQLFFWYLNVLCPGCPILLGGKQASLRGLMLIRKTKSLSTRVPKGFGQHLL